MQGHVRERFFISEFVKLTATHHLVVLGPRERLLLLVGQMWDREQLSALALDLTSRGVPLVPIDQPTTPRQLRALDPRLVPWRRARPVAVVLLTVLTVLLLLVAAFVIYGRDPSLTGLTIVLVLVASAQRSAVLRSPSLTPRPDGLCLGSCVPPETPCPRASTQRGAQFTAELAS